MKKILSYVGALLILLGVADSTQAQTSYPASIHLSAYVENDDNTPSANKILYDKLNRIISNYGLSAPTSLQSPFIITAHPVELRSETTGTIPPKTIYEISLTFYIGNGVENMLFSNCNIELRGVGDTRDKAYASAFRKIDVNDPKIKEAIDVAQMKIAQYYQAHGPSLIEDAKRLATSGNYGEAYATLLRIPPVSPNYKEAQELLTTLVTREADTYNTQVITRARAAWSASPNEEGAAEAKNILDELQNPSEKIFAQADALLNEIGKRLQHNEDVEEAAQSRREAREHQARMATLDGINKAAIAKAKASRPVVYGIRWW